MEFNRLTKYGAAIHEAGHAAAACAVGLYFEYVHVTANEKTDWGGQCLLRSDHLLSQVKMAAFQMGGPLAQLLHLPATLGDDLVYFKTSLFAHAEALAHAESDVLLRLCWAGDLANPSFMQSAAKLAKTPDFAKKFLLQYWLFDLEKLVRAFFRTAECSCFILALAEHLRKVNRVEDAPARALFTQMVPERTYESLARFCSEHQ